LEPDYGLEDQEQVDKIIRIKENCPSIQKVIYWDSKGLCLPRAVFFELGRIGKPLRKDYGKKHPDLVKENISKIKGDDIA